jgi:hypothetical protein
MAQKRKQEHLLKLGRSQFANRLYTNLDKKRLPENKTPRFKLSNLLNSDLWIWLTKTILSNLGAGRYPYQTYTNPAVDNGVYTIPDAVSAGEVHVAILGDWASNTDESDSIGKQAAEHQPHYSIHIGDVYYSGGANEIDDNFGIGGTWPKASEGNFALIGNHEMYSHGKGYFTRLLPYMHRKTPSGSLVPQQAPFFCLENNFWRIIALDTGYDCLKWFIHSTNRNLDLPAQQKAWLKEQVFKKPDDKRGIILVSHHQYITAFNGESEFHNPADTLAQYLGIELPVLWFWGHEHRFSIYGSCQVGKGIKAFGRCIGHAGMPIEILPKITPSNPARDKKLVLFDNRCREKLDNTLVGYNGYAVLKLNQNKLTVEYMDYKKLGGKNGVLVQEEWEINNGQLEGKTIVDYTTNDSLSHHLKNIPNATGKLTLMVNDIREAIK